MDSSTLNKQARELLENNTQHVFHNGRAYRFSVPSPASYPFQWFWDSCFHAVVWTRFDVERAKDEIRALFTAQRAEGFIPHVIFWNSKRVHRVPWQWNWLETKDPLFCLPGFPKPRTTELMQPPLLAQAIERIWRTDRDKHFLAETLPKANLYYQWLAQNRDPDHDHLLTIIAPFESGLDWSPAFDQALGFPQKGSAAELQIRGRLGSMTNKLFFGYNLKNVLEYGLFHVEDVFVNSIYALNLEVLAVLNRVFGDHQTAQRWETEAQNVMNALIEKCWDDSRKAFFNLDGRGEKRSTALTLQALMPLILQKLPRSIVDALVHEHIQNSDEFWLPYPLPFVAANEPTFSPQSFAKGSRLKFHWRGPTWVNTNWYLAHGLRQHGYTALADHIAQKTKEMVAKSGFREYFNPFTAAGLSAKSFGWSTLVVDI